MGLRPQLYATIHIGGYRSRRSPGRRSFVATIKAGRVREGPDGLQVDAVLAAVKAWSGDGGGRGGGGATTILDGVCARRRFGGRSGRRNGVWVEPRNSSNSAGVRDCGH